MSYSIAVDFGTTNTVVARWLDDDHAPQTISLRGASRIHAGMPPSIPSMVYVDAANDRRHLIGQEIMDLGLDQLADDPSLGHLFVSMKRALLDPTYEHGVTLGTGRTLTMRDAAEIFLNELCVKFKSQGFAADPLIFTVPVSSFESYLRWLAGAIHQLMPSDGGTIRIIDEPTAAAFGCGIDDPGSLVMVIDFGGGTLDLALVRMPEHGRTSNATIHLTPHVAPESTLHAHRRRIAARVIAKSSPPRHVGGSHVDSRIVDLLLQRQGLTRSQVLPDLSVLTLLAEEAKIALSTATDHQITAYIRSRRVTVRYSLRRDEFVQDVLNSPELAILDVLRDAIRQIIRTAESGGIGIHNIDHLVLVGGTTLIPAVKDSILERFPNARLHHSKPFESVAHGALELCKGQLVDDLLKHTYAIEYRTPEGGYGYLPIVREGTRYPFDEEIEIRREGHSVPLKPLEDYQDSMTLVVAEVEEQDHPGQRTVYSPENKLLPERCLSRQARQQIIHLLNRGLVVPLRPLGMRQGQEDRIRVYYMVDENRNLLLSVRDDRAGERYLIRQERVTRLR